MTPWRRCCFRALRAACLLIVRTGNKVSRAAEYQRRTKAPQTQAPTPYLFMQFASAESPGLSVHMVTACLVGGEEGEEVGGKTSDNDLFCFLPAKRSQIARLQIAEMGPRSLCQATRCAATAAELAVEPPSFTLESKIADVDPLYKSYSIYR